MNDPRRNDLNVRADVMQPGVSVNVSDVMRNVYTWMAGGLLLTALVAFIVAQVEPLQQALVESPGLLIIAIVVELGLVLAISAGINRMAPSTAGMLFLVYSAVNGITFSLIFLAYDGGTIAYAFIATAAMFGAMSVVGYTTQMDLSKIGSILFMGLIGLIVVSILNIFIGSSFLYWIISIAGVVIFTGLTAWDTQRIKQMAEQSAMMGSDGALVQQRITIIGALTLYLDFINLFLYMLRLISYLQDN